MKTGSLQSIMEILLTDHCNQNCPFCFAREEMKSPQKQEISLSDVKMIRDKCIANGILNVALTGGEPTLHTDFRRIVELFRRDFFRIYINTNGSFSDETAAYLRRLGNRITLLFNVTTPGFIFNREMRKRVMERIDSLSDGTSVSAVITSKFVNAKEAKMIVDLFPDRLIGKITVRIGVEGVIAGGKNYTTVEEFPKIGPHFMEALTYIEKRGAKDIRLGKSITPCMFSKKDLAWLKKRGYLKTYHCHPEDEGRWFGINPSLEAFMCYPLSTRDRLTITPDSDFKKIRAFYAGKQREYEHIYALPQCRGCPFYGLEEGRCPGPCAGFRINASAGKSLVAKY